MAGVSGRPERRALSRPHTGVAVARPLAERPGRESASQYGMALFLSGGLADGP